MLFEDASAFRAGVSISIKERCLPVYVCVYSLIKKSVDYASTISVFLQFFFRRNLFGNESNKISEIDDMDLRVSLIDNVKFSFSLNLWDLFSYNTHTERHIHNKQTKINKNNP